MAVVTVVAAAIADVHGGGGRTGHLCSSPRQKQDYVNRIHHICSTLL